MTIIKNSKQHIERDSRSPVYSHQEGYSDQVHAICHHSGRYLTHHETNPTARLLLREQHDFPGLPELDRSFSKAAHSRQHEHWIWSEPGIQGTALIISGMAVITLAYYISLLKDFVSAGLWVYLYWSVIALVVIGSAICIVHGFALMLQREKIFHQWAQRMPPAIPDFPVQCTYKVKIEENLTAQLGNTVTYPENLAEQNGRITVTIHPEQNDLETFKQYQEQYKMHPVGKQVMAGVIALRGLAGVNFLSPNVDFDHRVILRAPSTSLKFDQDPEIYDPFDIVTNYTISPSSLYVKRKGFKQFPLQCEPIISHDDSRTLELRFTWRSPRRERQLQNLRIVLEECTLKSISDDYLKPVISVRHGRYDPESEHVKWRNLDFNKLDTGNEWQLNLRVTFEYPIINCLEHIVGKYKFRMNGLVSNLQTDSNHIWTAWGLRARENDCLIRENAVIQGVLRINPQLLSQEHEHVTGTDPIICLLPPDANMVGKVLKVVRDEGFELQQVWQAPPRLHPTGRLDARVQYWDVVGRRYNPETLDAIDIHIVISGYERISGLSTRKKIQPRSRIDIRLRCLHDPRNKQTSEQVDALIGKHTENGYIEQQSMPPDIPAHLYDHLREVLLNCGPFSNGRTLRSIFADSRINEWQDYLPEAETMTDRVDATVNILYPRKSATGQNALVLLLGVLQDRVDPMDRNYRQLNMLTNEVRQLVVGTDGVASASSTISRVSSETLGLINRIKQAIDCEAEELD